ncbi:MAG: succinate dehydrogenase, cytochrome b556 subunit [Acidobacteria bacterium]|nr:succinate dehydrogenase, cytochrome b556 subunit [Acidobacteriota bacterium]
MAQNARPLSPHLQVYRWRANMAVSILHRATGSGLAIGGTLIMLWWLLAAASGGSAYDYFLAAAHSWIGCLVLVALTWGFLQHMLSGLRHLYMDTGAGYEPAKSRRLAMLTMVGSAGLTALIWAAILLRGQGGVS